MYYYWKRRIGGRVVSQYVGNSPLIHDMLEEMEALDPEKHQRQIEQQDREQFEKIDRELDKRQAEIRVLMKRVYRANGYHNHNGEWRRKRQ